MSLEHTPLLTDPRIGIKNADGEDLALEQPIDVDAFMRSFKATQNILLAISVLLVCPAYTLSSTPEAQSSRVLRTLAYLTWELGMLSVLAAGALRLRAWAVRREGRTAQFASDVLALRAARVRSEAAFVVQAQRWLFCGFTVCFFIVLAGYTGIRCAGVPIGDKLPLNLLEAATYQMCILGSGVFAARYIIVAGKLGVPHAPAPEVSQAEQVAAEQEKV